MALAQVHAGGLPALAPGIGRDVAMALVANRWIGAASADWGASAANWSRGLPTSNDNVLIATQAVLTVSYSGADTYVVHSLSVGRDFFDMSGGSLTIVTKATFADGFTQTGGVLSAGGTVTVAGAGTLTGGAAEGKTAFVFDGTIALSGYLLGGGASLGNKKTTNLTGQITLGDNTGVGARIDNAKGGIFNIAGDFGIGQGAASARFVNAGTIEKTAGANTSFIDVNLTSSGRIVVATGTIELRGPQNRLAGRISGAGRFVLGNGSKDAIAKGTTISTAAFTITDGGTVASLAGNLAYARTFTIDNGGAFDLLGVTKLTLSGANTFANALIETGDGLMVTAHGGTTDINTLTFGGTRGWENSGIVGEVNTLQLGDSTFNAPVFFNLRGGVYDFTTDSGIARGAAVNSGFVNEAGAVLEKKGGGGNSVVAVDYSGAGRIEVRTGEIELVGVDNVVAGTVSGRGQFAFGGGGSDVVARGAAFAVDTFGIYDNGTLVTLGENLDYTGAFNLEAGSAVDLAGFTLTLGGTDTFLEANFGFPAIIGTGTLVTVHGSTTSVNGFSLAGALVWKNHGTVAAVGPLTLGNPNPTYGVATFVNEKGGIYDFSTDSGIGLGLVPTSRFVNDRGAVVKKTAGTGDSVIAVLFTNDGGVRADSGKIEFQRPVGGTGSFSIATGAVLQFDNSVAKELAVDFASHRGGELLLFDSKAFGATIHGFGGKRTDSIDVADVAFNGARLRYSGSRKQGVLTATSGTATARLVLFGDYTKADFHASADPFGGTLITVTSAHAGMIALST